MQQKPPTKTIEKVAAKTTQETAKTDDITTVKRGDNNGADGSGVKIRGEVDETKVGEVKVTSAEGNKIGGDGVQTSDTIPNVKIHEITQKRLSEKAKETRNKLKELSKEGKVSRKVAEYGNIAVAEVDIPGVPKEFIAHSSINTPNAKAAQYGTFSYQPEIRNLESYVKVPTGTKGATIEEVLKKKLLIDIMIQRQKF